MGDIYAEICVAVTGLNANDNPGPGVAVARALKEAFGVGLRIIGLAYEALEAGIYVPGLIEKTYQIPYPSAGAEALASRIAQIHSEETINVVIPNFDAELHNFISIEKRLRKFGIAMFLPSHEQLNMRDKVNLNRLGNKLGLNVPHDRLINNEAELYTAAEKLSYPLVIKGKYYEATIAHNADSARKAFYELSAKWGLPVIAQQFISGTEINIAAIGDGEGYNLSIVPMRKLYITDKGKAWAGVTIEDDQLIALADKFAGATKWRGGYELEIVRGADGQLYILEINPRFPAWIYLTAAAGQNQPEVLVQMALGHQPQKMTAYQTGKMFVRYSWDNVVDISDFQQMSAFGELKTNKNAKAYL
ncbi:ATP-grasp domain-containing protein [Mucilaginibacter ginkgonis]|uniref:ATP-grasp domain-containing protein n=1 Tax=Mucilaginibacter ginkgonis TaxID=2682091 RepID=A0A6I4HUD9_9SPHI|nr:ATP-grasp domain-containing protein [Mucilaginibacter ginkgonis]QQL50233.1 ATP-grasp domain-containing protein [Mucilaginibacter ginkgonis]